MGFLLKVAVILLILLAAVIWIIVCGIKERNKKMILIILSANIAFGVCGCGNMNHKNLEEIKEGYNIEEVDNNSFFITQDGVDYYFDITWNKVVLKKIVVIVESKDEIAHSVENQGQITITRLGKNKINVLLTIAKTDQNDDGKEFITDGYISIEFKDNFEEENITNNHGFHDVVSDYYYVTDNFLSADELQKIYDSALELENELKD